MGGAGHLAIEVGLTAAIVAAPADEPLILVARGGAGAREASLPTGVFDALRHRTFEIALRAFVADQADAPLGYVEQLYTFGDRGRHAEAGDREPHFISVCYLGLSRAFGAAAAARRGAAGLRGWYAFFPWEDWRAGRPRILDEEIAPRLRQWAARAESAAARSARRERVDRLFGLADAPIDEERALERYECLYEAGLVAEARRDGRDAALAWPDPPPLGEPMRFDHRRILATAMGRLRSKLKYRPVIFELMPETFTLTALQHSVEAISGRRVHKQNFRRLVSQGALVEPTGESSRATGGRPAALYRFRGEARRERAAPGARI